MTRKAVQVRNVTRGTTLMTRGHVADNRWTRLKGLIGVQHLAPGDGLLIKPCKGVHCMFMSIPIDVVYVDRNHQVVGLDEKMAPWRVGRIYGKSLYVLEVPTGTIASTATRVGDTLELAD